MKHIKFEFAEPLVTIQRVRNEIFLGDDGALWVLSPLVKQQIEFLLMSEHIPVKRLRPRREDGYCKIHLGFMHHFDLNLEDDEIIIVKGQNRVWMENALGEDVTPEWDLGIKENLK